MDIIDKLLIQLKTIKRILDKEVEQKEYCKDYHIYEDQCSLLDISELQAYLTQTKVKNTIFLKDIINLCMHISNIRNNQFQEFRVKTRNNTENKMLDFHAFHLTEKKIIRYEMERNKNLFMSKFKFKIKIINIHAISLRCEEIVEYITAAYPETIPDFINSNVDKYKNFAWFEVGILFATGEMLNLQLIYNNNATQIAKFKFHNEWKKYRPYISESISNTTSSDKNIFSSNTKLLKIKKHCAEKNIHIISDFINQIKPK